MIDFKKKFCQRLREARKKANLTQAELGEKIEVGHAAIGHMETGHHSPTFDSLCRLAETLGVSLDWLAGLDSPITSGVPKWVVELLPVLRSLDQPGREAIQALVAGYKAKRR